MPGAQLAPSTGEEPAGTSPPRQYSLSAIKPDMATRRVRRLKKPGLGSYAERQPSHTGLLSLLNSFPLLHILCTRLEADNVPFASAPALCLSAPGSAICLRLSFLCDLSLQWHVVCMCICGSNLYLPSFPLPPSPETYM